MEEEIKILKNLIEYLQFKIDSGEHKIIYNDLMYDEKTIDCINSIENLIKAYKELKEIEESHRKENGELRERVKELEENINKQKQLTKIAQTITDESIKEALIEFEKDYIPVSLVEEKRDYYKKEIDKMENKKIWNEPMDTIIKNRFINYFNVLQELLEKRK